MTRYYEIHHVFTGAPPEGSRNAKSILTGVTRSATGSLPHAVQLPNGMITCLTVSKLDSESTHCQTTSRKSQGRIPNRGSPVTPSFVLMFG